MFFTKKPAPITRRLSFELSEAPNHIVERKNRLVIEERTKRDRASRELQRKTLDHVKHGNTIDISRFKLDEKYKMDVSASLHKETEPFSVISIAMCGTQDGYFTSEDASMQINAQTLLQEIKDIFNFIDIKDPLRPHTIILNTCFSKKLANKILLVNNDQKIIPSLKTIIFHHGGSNDGKLYTTFRGYKVSNKGLMIKSKLFSVGV